MFIHIDALFVIIIERKKKKNSQLLIRIRFFFRSNEQNEYSLSEGLPDFRSLLRYRGVLAPWKIWLVYAYIEQNTRLSYIFNVPRGSSWNVKIRFISISVTQTKISSNFFFFNSLWKNLKVWFFKKSHNKFQ